MQKILKRLELIKTAIIIEDEEIIELQAVKLNAMSCDDEVEGILNKIANKDYGDVILDIEEYVQKFSGLVVYEDKELQGLRLELKALERKLQELSSEKNEYLNDIDDFNIQYHLRLGETIQKILNLKETLLEEAIQEKRNAFESLKEEYEAIREEQQELKSKKQKQEQVLEDMDAFDDGYDELYEELQELKDTLDEKEQELNEKRKETKNAKEAFEEDDVTQEYEEVKQDSEEFSREYEEVKKEERPELSAEEKKELKKLFRKASRICHPDIVADELKEQAHDMMSQLNDAYSKHDIVRIQEILLSLENGTGFNIASDTITNKKQLRTKIVDIRNMMALYEKELQDIEENEVLKIMKEYDDLEEYFTALETELEAEYERLKAIHTKNITKSDTNKDVPNEFTQVDEDDYWSNEF